MRRLVATSQRTYHYGLGAFYFLLHIARNCTVGTNAPGNTRKLARSPVPGGPDGFRCTYPPRVAGPRPVIDSFHYLHFHCRATHFPALGRLYQPTPATAANSSAATVAAAVAVAVSAVSAVATIIGYARRQCWARCLVAAKWLRSFRSAPIYAWCHRANTRSRIGRSHNKPTPSSVVTKKIRHSAPST